MKIEHIRNAIDTQKEVMLEIIERQGGPTTDISQFKYCEQIVKNYMSLCHKANDFIHTTVVSKNVNFAIFVSCYA